MNTGSDNVSHRKQLLDILVLLTKINLTKLLDYDRLFQYHKNVIKMGFNTFAYLRLHILHSFTWMWIRLGLWHKQPVVYRCECDCGYTVYPTLFQHHVTLNVDQVGPITSTASHVLACMRLSECLVYCIMIIHSVSAPPHPECGSGWAYDINSQSCIGVRAGVVVSWEEANRRCIEEEGAHLVSVSHPTHQTFIDGNILIYKQT